MDRARSGSRSLISIRWLFLACVGAVAWACEHDPELGCAGQCLDGSVAGSGGSGGAGAAAGSGNVTGDAGPDDAGDAAVDTAPPCPFIDPAIVTPALPCEIEAILKAKCQRCHQDPPQNGAPFPLLTWENTQATYLLAPIYKRMYNAISTGFMPYKGSVPPLDPPVEDLTDDEKAKLLDWLDACGPPVEATTCP